MMTADDFDNKILNEMNDEHKIIILSAYKTTDKRYLINYNKRYLINYNMSDNYPWLFENNLVTYYSGELCKLTDNGVFVYNYLKNDMEAKIQLEKIDEKTKNLLLDCEYQQSVDGYLIDNLYGKHHNYATYYTPEYSKLDAVGVRMREILIEEEYIRDQELIKDLEQGEDDMEVSTEATALKPVYNGLPTQLLSELWIARKNEVYKNNGPTSYVFKEENLLGTNNIEHTVTVETYFTNSINGKTFMCRWFFYPLRSLREMEENFKNPLCVSEVVPVCYYDTLETLWESN